MTVKNKTVIKIFKELSKSEYGYTIQNLIDRTGIARGTVKSYLLHLMVTDNVVEINYGQNTKIYIVKQKELKDNKIVNSVYV